MCYWGWNPGLIRQAGAVPLSVIPTLTFDLEQPNLLVWIVFQGGLAVELASVPTTQPTGSSALEHFHLLLLSNRQGLREQG